MSNLAKYNPSISVIDAEIVAENYLQRVPADYRDYLRQPIIHLSQIGEIASIHQLLAAAIDRQEAKLYRWVRELQPEIEALKRRQDALEDRLERLERRPNYHPAADEPPSNSQLLSIIFLLFILAAMLVGGAIDRDISPQPERIRTERGIYRD